MSSDLTKYKKLNEKNIPIFAGLGGGTSNAFTVMKYVLFQDIQEVIK